jgi:DNA-binding GntR family transcriptional regulator
MSNSDATSTSTDRIYQELRRTIITGQHQPGDRLPMESLAESFGTSVTPVREALRMLLKDGLVTMETHAGYFVSRISLRQLDALLDLRSILEVAAVERATTRITAEQLEELEELQSGPPLSEGESPQRFVDRSLRFHQVIAEASGNPELVALIDNLNDKLALFVVSHRQGVVAPSVHARIVQALRDRDVVAARQAIVDEIQTSREVLIRQVIEREGANWYIGVQS